MNHDGPHHHLLSIFRQSTLIGLFSTVKITVIPPFLSVPVPISNTFSFWQHPVLVSSSNFVLIIVSRSSLPWQRRKQCQTPFLWNVRRANGQPWLIAPVFKRGVTIFRTPLVAGQFGTHDRIKSGVVKLKHNLTPVLTLFFSGLVPKFFLNWSKLFSSAECDDDFIRLLCKGNFVARVASIQKTLSATEQIVQSIVT